VESNLNIKKTDTPKLNVETVSSAVFGKEDGAGGGSGESIKNIHKTLSKLSGHVRKSLIRIKALEFNLSKITPKVEEVENKLVVNTEKTTEVENKVIINTEKIVKIEEILKNKKDSVGDNIGGNQDNLSKSLIETNKILVGIQQQLALQSSNEQKEQKRESEEEKREKSRGKLKAEESALEKSGKRIGKAVGKLTSKILSPIKGLFDQVLDFILTLGAGVAVNAAFEWLSKEENRKKVENAFEYVKKHWKWIAGVAAGIVLFGPAVSLISAIVSLAGALLTVGGFVASVLGAPAFLTLLGVITAAGGIYLLNDYLRNKTAGGTGFRAAIEKNVKTIDDIPNITRDGKILSNAIGSNGRRLPFREQGNLNSGMQDVRVDGLGGFQDPVDITPERMKKYGVTQEQIDIFRQYQKNARIINIQRKAMEKELKESKAKIYTGRGTFGRPVPNKQFEESEKTEYAAETEKIRSKYNETVPGMLEFQARAMGGPTTAGKIYEVGEKGRELFAPNVDGSVINNMRTEKIYQMISSGRKGRGGIDMITLSPITNQMPPPEIPVPQGPATEVPDISSVNMADPYRQITPMLYGITV
jgi:hypothetical protein